MNIGYACLALGVDDTSMKRCLLKNADEEILSGLIINNLESLKNLINYNVKNGIKLFRISSDLIPFGSSPINKIQWWDENALQLQEISLKIQASGMRISMHPGQYTVLNSNNEDVVERTIKDLEYHAKVLDCLTTNYKHKIILHIGGVYNDKNKAIDRFIRNYKGLPMEVKRRLVIENDDKSYNISDVLSIGKILNIPVVFDNLHHEINPPELELYIEEWIDLAKKTWHKKDGVQKIHYSQQNNQKKRGSHSKTIKVQEFIQFYKLIAREDIDIMLEVKDKNLSTIKCINIYSKNRTIKLLEEEWSKYKYAVLEKSQLAYNDIRKLLKNKKAYPVVMFYSIIENSLEQEEDIGKSINSIQHVWGYFKNKASEYEKNKYQKDIMKYQNNDIKLKSIKNFLFKMALKYEEEYLLNSYYFIL